MSINTLKTRFVCEKKKRVITSEISFISVYNVL